MIKQTIAKILDTEMERKDFLKLVGVGAVAAVGVSQIFKAVSHSTGHKAAVAPDQSYGGLAYGGAPKKSL